MEASLKIIWMLGGAYALFKMLRANQQMNKFIKLNIVRPLGDGVVVNFSNPTTIGELPKFDIKQSKKIA